MIHPRPHDAAEQPLIRPSRVGEPRHITAAKSPAQEDPGADTVIGSTLSLVAEYGGCLVAGVNLTLSDDHTAMVQGLWIDPAWTESDLPLRMMVAALGQGRRLGCIKVDMETGVRGLAIVAMLLDSGLLDRAAGETWDEFTGMANCYLNLDRNVSIALA